MTFDWGDRGFVKEDWQWVDDNIKKECEKRPSAIGVCVYLQKLMEDEAKQRAKNIGEPIEP